METKKSKHINKKISLGVSVFKSIDAITCYMNSIISILQQTPLFTDYIVMGKFTDNLLDNIDADKINSIKKYKEKIYTTVIYHLYQIMKISLEHDVATITPNSFKKIIGTKNDIWNEYNHQDSQEFFTFLITTLEEEIGLKKKFIPGKKFNKNICNFKNKSLLNILTNIEAQKSWENFIANEYSVLKMIFTGLLYNEIKCNLCTSKNNSFQTFITLPICIPITKNNIQNHFTNFKLKDCLDNFILSEQLDKNNKVKCNLCKKKNKCHQKMTLWRAPPILVIHIKRFIMDDYGRMSRKITNNVSYPIRNLDMTPYFSEYSPHKENAKYNLFAINIHQELGYVGNINSGHYISIVKNRYNNKWYVFNDSNKPIKLSYKKDLQQKNAYMLFYQRI